MYVYRVDAREFSVGDIITNSNGEYQGKFKGEKQIREDFLRRTSPENTPSRSHVLFLFINLSDAIRFWKRYGGNIYVVLSQGVVYHRGDMNKLDNLLDIIRFSENEDLYVSAANEYWKPGTHTFSPAYELLCESAEVLKLILTEEDRASFEKELAAKTYIERTPTYLRLLNEMAGIAN